MKAPAESLDSESARLPRITKAFYALGDHTINLSLFVLDLSGYREGAQQSNLTMWTIRSLTAGAPGVFVLLAAWVTLRYPLSRARHAEILQELQVRRQQGSP